MRLREPQERALIVVAFVADAGAGFGQSIEVSTSVAGGEMESAGYEVWLRRDADGLAAGGIDVVGAAVGIQQQGWPPLASSTSNPLLHWVSFP